MASEHIYGETQGRKLLRSLTESGHSIFTAEQAHAAVRRLGIPETYETVLLSNLVRGRWLRRLRRGLYAIADVQVHPFAIATRLVEPSAISHWSALNHHGLTEQIPQAVSAITPTKIVTPSMREGKASSERHAWQVEGVFYQYMNVKREYFFGIENVWVSELFRVPITDKERTVLETFVSPRFFGGIGEGLSILEQQRDKLDLKRLVAYAMRYQKGSVARRLGWALEQAGVPDKTLAPLQRIKVTGMTILDPTRPKRGPCNSRWQIQENLPGRAS